MPISPNFWRSHDSHSRRFCPEDNSMAYDTQSIPLFQNSLPRQPRCRRTLADTFGRIFAGPRAAPLRPATPLLCRVLYRCLCAGSAVLVSTTLGLGADSILRHRLVSSAPWLCAAWVSTAGTRRRLSSAPQPGLCSALTLSAAWTRRWVEFYFEIFTSAAGCPGQRRAAQASRAS